MSTYGQLVYLVLDEAKGLSDDFTYTEDHIIFILDKYRALLLKQRYSDIRKEMPDSNYQALCLDLIEVPAISGIPCEGGNYLRSTVKVPELMQIGSVNITTRDYFQGEIAYVSKERMRYVGNNKYLKNMIYASIAPDKYLYFKSNNPQFLHLDKIQITGIFQDASQAAELVCDDSNEVCEIVDREFPLEEALIPTVMELTLKELLGAAYRPKDDTNNANDDLADIASFIRNHMKKDFRSQSDI